MTSFIFKIAEDFRSYKRPIIQQGFWALAFHRYGEAVGGLRFRLFYIPLRILHHVLIKTSEILFGIYIGPNVKMGRRVVIEHFGNIVINSGATIGDDVRIRHEVTIGNKSAEYPNDVPTIEDGVDIGAGAKILGNIRIGRFSVIGANAVVINSVPEHSLAVGVPARIIPRKLNS